jgi:predicted DNA-binding transcriptional regulator YafY
MAETSARLLSLLSLLQSPRDWPGPELARRLEVSTRTVRNDVERLRRLGYPVEATRGAVGGYRLSAGAAMPPLLLEDDEAVAVVVSLRTATGGAIEGLEETSLRALSKLQQVLPPRLARRVDALSSHTVRVGGGQRQGGRGRGTQVEGGMLALIAAAARDREILRFRYSDHSGSSSARRVEPYRLVNWARRWYLVAFDIERDDWRTFRADRITDPSVSGHRFTLRPLPADDIAGYVAARTRQVQMKVQGRVIMHLPAEQVAARMGPWSASIEARDEGSCLLQVGGRSVEDIAFWLGVLDADFEIVDSPELAAAVRQLADRYARAAAG